MVQHQRRPVSAVEVEQHSTPDHSHGAHGHAHDHVHQAPAADIFGSGGREIDHTTGAEVDAFVRAHDFFNYYIQSSFDRDGNGANGQITILDGDAFDAEWTTYAMARTNPNTGALFTAAEAVAFPVAAFVDNGRIILHARRGNEGTAIHESMHLFTHSTYLREMGFNINEGTTELFTRILCRANSIRRRGNYQAQYTSLLAVAEGLERGHNLLASAYFDGNYSGLREAMNEVPGRYEQWKALMAANNFNAAAALF